MTALKYGINTAVEYRLKPQNAVFVCEGGFVYAYEIRWQNVFQLIESFPECVAVAVSINSNYFLFNNSNTFYF